MRMLMIGTFTLLACAAVSSWCASPAAGVTAAPACAGDCDENGAIAVDELVDAIGIGLGIRPLEDCPAADRDASGTVDVSELVLAVHHALDGCPSDGALFTIRACVTPEDPDGQTFRALIRDPAVIAEAESLIGAGSRKILSGRLLAGSGGFNAPWSWHLDPSTVGFSEFTIELCDGCPAFVEADLDYWLDDVGQYCPWSTEVVARAPTPTPVEPTVTPTADPDPILAALDGVIEMMCNWNSPGLFRRAAYATEHGYTIICDAATGHDSDAALVRHASPAEAALAFAGATGEGQSVEFHGLPAAYWQTPFHQGGANRYLVWQIGCWIVTAHNFDDTHFEIAAHPLPFSNAILDTVDDLLLAQCP